VSPDRRASAGLKRTEHAEAVALMRVVRLHEVRWPELRLLYAVPSGGDRHPIVAAKMRAEGVRAGVPDYCLPVARGGYHGLYIELKTATGYASREQRDLMHADGHFWTFTGGAEPLPERIQPLPPQQAREAFLARYATLKPNYY
jgi:hypothetical protein